MTLLATVASAAPALPLTLEAPRDGRRVVVGPGPRATHVVLFATWCPPCVDELEPLRELEARWGKQGYRLVLVAVPARHSADRLVVFMDQHRPPGELLFDRGGDAERKLEAQAVPAHLVFDASGHLVARSGGLNAEIDGALRGLMAERGRPPRREP